MFVVGVFREVSGSGDHDVAVIRFGQKDLGVVESKADSHAVAGSCLSCEKIDPLGCDSFGVCGDVEVQFFDLSGVVPLHYRVYGCGSDGVCRDRQAPDRPHGLNDPDDECHRVELIGCITEDAFARFRRYRNVFLYDLDLCCLHLFVCDKFRRRLSLKIILEVLFCRGGLIGFW